MKKPTDEAIEKMYSHVTDNIEPEGTPALLKGYWNQVVDLMQKAARWARDYDPWHYVSDGELPELHHLQKHKYGTDKISEKILFKVDDRSLGYYTNGHYRLDESSDGAKYYFEEEPTQTEFELGEIKCWQPIVEPQK